MFPRDKVMLKQSEISLQNKEEVKTKERQIRLKLKMISTPQCVL